MSIPISGADAAVLSDPRQIGFVPLGGSDIHDFLARNARSTACKRTQEETISIPIALARAGQTVVRLKGGDPLIFGRGGEEARALQRARIPFEIVPGVNCVADGWRLDSRKT